MPPRSSIRERLIRHSVMGPGGCWLWTGERRFGGYGYIIPTRHSRAVRPTAVRVHRASYEAFVGPIPEGAVLKHSCDVRTCINPAHLSPGSTAENNREIVARGRHGNQWRRSLS